MMIERIYGFLQGIGYNHPIHPALTHIVVGTTIAAFIFMLLARLTHNAAYLQSARHCTGLALVFTPIVALAGFLDWQQLFSGAWLWPIRIKIGLAALLLTVLILAQVVNKNRIVASGGMIAMGMISLAVVIGLGYFGGELVYGQRPLASSTDQRPVLVEEGKALFQAKCSFCHFTDSRTTKVGPGLQHLFEWERLPTSGWPAAEENIRRQIVEPFAGMPAFDSLSERELDAVIAYLKTL
jgi:uncharacterized membrane protein/cytochrome c5